MLFHNQHSKLLQTMSSILENSISVESAHASLAHEVKVALDRHLCFDTPSLNVLLDNPSGFAMNYLLGRSCPQCIVITDNPCPEYWDDLWDLRPRALLAGGHSLDELINAINRVFKGEIFRKTPFYETPLTIRERQCLMLCARGLNNAEIAAALGVKKRTVKNYLTYVYDKLNLKNREQAILYYWGMWHWLNSLDYQPQ